MKKLPAAFYRTSTGNQPVRDWLSSLTLDDRRIVGGDIASVEFGWPVGMPICRALGGGLWEVRSTLAAGRTEARVYFTIDGGMALLLHGHTGKDSQRRDIATARDRQADHRQRKGIQNE